MSSKWRALILAARPKTLVASAVPVGVATALVVATGHELQWWISLLALSSAMAIQIATNFFNDAIDFAKGADTEARLGEARVTQKGLLSAKQVMRMAFGFVALAVVLGAPLVWWGGWPILVTGLISLVLAYSYTGGPFPLAYLGLGDLFVILFFGLVAVNGVFFLHTGTVTTASLIAGLQVGLLATVLIAINNLRDVEQDVLVDKKTLAVRLGPKLAKWEVPFLFIATLLLGLYWFSQGHIWAALMPLSIGPIAFLVSRTVMTVPPGQVYNRVLASAAKAQLFFGLSFSLGLWLR